VASSDSQAPTAKPGAGMEDSVLTMTGSARTADGGVAGVCAALVPAAVIKAAASVERTTWCVQRDAAKMVVKGIGFRYGMGIGCGMEHGETVPL